MSSTWLTSPPSFAALAGAPALEQRGDARCQPLQLRRHGGIYRRVVDDGLLKRRSHRQHPLVVLLVVEGHRGGFHNGDRSLVPDAQAQVAGGVDGEPRPAAQRAVERQEGGESYILDEISQHLTVDLAYLAWMPQIAVAVYGMDAWRDHRLLTSAPELYQRCLIGFDHQPGGHEPGQGVLLSSRYGVAQIPVVRVGVLLPAALYGVWEEETGNGGSVGVVEVDVNDPGGTAEHHADVAPIDEVTGQFFFTQLPLMPVLEDGPLSVERGYVEAAMMVLQGRIKGILELYLANKGEAQSFSAWV
jgi:hypothetical protein